MIYEVFQNRYPRFEFWHLHLRKLGISHQVRMLKKAPPLSALLIHVLLFQLTATIWWHYNRRLQKLKILHHERKLPLLLIWRDPKIFWFPFLFWAPKFVLCYHHFLRLGTIHEESKQLTLHDPYGQEGMPDQLLKFGSNLHFLGWNIKNHSLLNLLNQK